MQYILYTLYLYIIRFLNHKYYSSGLLNLLFFFIFISTGKCSNTQKHYQLELEIILIFSGWQRKWKNGPGRSWQGWWRGRGEMEEEKKEAGKCIDGRGGDEDGRKGTLSSLACSGEWWAGRWRERIPSPRWHLLLLIITMVGDDDFWSWSPCLDDVFSLPQSHPLLRLLVSDLLLQIQKVFLFLWKVGDASIAL